MDYEKKYKEALGKAKRLYEKGTITESLCHIFPELEGSEDERIRKELIKHLKEGVEGYMPSGGSEDYARWLTGVEKQGEQDNNEDEAILHRFSFYSYKDEPNILYLAGLYVNDKYRNKGIGTKILEVADEVAKSLNCHAIRLKTKKDSNAERLYQTHGYNSLAIEGRDKIWLEKQSEQKPIIEMKSAEESLGISSEEYNDIVNECLYGESESFKVGDWITNGDYTWKIIEVKPLDYILQSQDGNIVDDTISHVDEQFHSFTIKDVKDGDILATDKSVFIYAKTLYNKPYAYCGVDKYGVFKDNCLKNNWANSVNNIHPATKEQRDTLMKAMADAGYTFDFEKKELKKIEKKSQRMVSAEAKEALYDKPTDEEMKELLRTEYEKGRADTIAEMKSSWSEEDERICQCLIQDQKEALEDVRNDKYGHSEIISDLEEMYRERIDWLESLKQRHTWKPSEEQIKTCKEVYADILSAKGFALGTINDELNRLEEQLKKLTE